MLLKADGTEEVLVAGGPTGAVIDPCVSFDGQWVFYAHSPDVTLNSQYFFTGIPVKGYDIYKIHVATRQIVRLTFQESTPNTSITIPTLPYGVMNTGPCPVSGGRVVFTSTRNQFRPPKSFSPITSQLYVMDDDGANVTAISPMTLSSSLHPFQLMDGRIAFSSMESQGLRDSRLWGLWAIWPDGRDWQPLMSAFANGNAFHFATQLTHGDIVLEDYYNLNNNGFGSFYRFPAAPPDLQFYPAAVTDNPAIPYVLENGAPFSYRYPYTPRGLVPMTPFTHPLDSAAPPDATGVRVGKGTHPSALPGGDMLVAWTRGPANNLNRPTPLPYYDSGIYIMPGGLAPTVNDLVLVKNDPAYNEQWPRALVPYKAIYGIDEPHAFPWLPNDGSPSLPAGTPYGVVGTSSLYKRESAPGVTSASNWDGLDALMSQTGANSNWFRQGADAGKYTNAEIWGIRLVALEPTSQGPPRKWFNHANERMRILGEVPISRASLDPEGNPDSSFSAKIPADVPFTFQVIDSRGQTLSMAQTWHQVRPGETRTSCGGCHAHSQPPLPFSTSASALRPPSDLAVTTLGDVEFIRDIRPLLQRSCVKCHSGTEAAASLDLNDLTLYAGTAPEPAAPSLPGDYARLARDLGARWGIKPWTSNRQWMQPQASRYIRKLQSKRSLLAWYVVGSRLDGWTNADHPSELVPGDPSTLPGGTASTFIADIDFVDTVNHGSLLTEAEQRKVLTWIDLGAPIDLGDYFKDEIRPTLTVSHPRPNANVGPISDIRVGVHDVGSGLNVSSLSVDGLPVGEPVQGGEGLYSVPLSTPLTSGTHTITVSVKDVAGNTTKQSVRFTVLPQPPVDCVQSEWSAWSDWSVCEDGFQFHTRSRTVVTEPAHGGAVCGDATETERQACEIAPPEDTIAPVVRVNAVRSGNSFNYTLTMTAEDEVGVVSQTLMFDGKVVANGSTVKVGYGFHLLFGTAQDAAGNVGAATFTVTR
jgi:hypothetical protein